MDSYKIFIGIISITLFYLLVYLITSYRKKKQIEITINDIILAIIPFAFLFGILGYISTLKISDFEIAFVKAAQSPIRPNVSELPIENVNYERKDGRDDLEKIVKSMPQALSFDMGYQNYDAKIMEQYIRRLSGSAKYVFFFSNIEKNNGGKLLSVIEMPVLYQQIFNSEFVEGDPNYLTVKDLYSILDKDDEKALLSIKGMIPFSSSITPETSKIEVLEKMEKLKTKLLPVNDTTSYFTKIVLKEDITTSLLLEVAKASKE